MVSPWTWRPPGTRGSGGAAGTARIWPGGHEPGRTTGLGRGDGRIVALSLEFEELPEFREGLRVPGIPVAGAVHEAEIRVAADPVPGALHLALGVADGKPQAADDLAGKAGQVALVRVTVLARLRERRVGAVS